MYDSKSQNYYKNTLYHKCNEYILAKRKKILKYTTDALRKITQLCTKFLDINCLIIYAYIHAP